MINNYQESDTIKDIIHSLSSLSGTLDSVFNRLDDEITNEKTRSSNLNNRIATCQQKIKGIKVSNQAITTVYPSSKFPNH